jgi:hypothetical protein
MRAPYSSVARRLAAGAFSGMTMVAATPSNRLARATAWAWLPDE